MKQFLLDVFSIFFPRCYFVHLISKLHRDAEADAFQPCRSTKIDAYLLHLPGFDNSDVSFEKKASKNEDEPFFGGGDKVGCCKYCQVEVNSNFIQKDIFGIFVMTYGAQTFAIKDRCKWLNGRNIHKTSTSSLCGRRNCNCALHQLIFILPPAGRFFLIEMM